MTKEIFIFITVFFLLLSVFSAGTGQYDLYEKGICLLLIFTIGIAHGSVDNVLYLRGRKMSNTSFILNYVVVVLLNVVLWLVLPVAAYLIFLLVSAYHFGQSQFSHHLAEGVILHNVLYVLWGFSVLSGMVYLNHQEVSQMVATVADLRNFGVVNEVLLAKEIYIATTLATVLLLVGFAIYGKITREVLLVEILTMGLINCSFYLFSFLTSFTLYFVVLHSVKVLREEYRYVLAHAIATTVGGFAKLLLPFTAVSVGGIVLLFLGIEHRVVAISHEYSLLILISSITIPHAYVMRQFYASSFGLLWQKA